MIVHSELPGICEGMHPERMWLIRVLLSHNMAATRCVFQTLLTLHTRKTWII